MADDKKAGGPQEDKILSRLRSTPAQRPAGVTSYIGLLGASPKEGYWLLYLNLDMTKSVEIKETDIIHTEQLPPDRSPFGSLGGTQVWVRQDAQVTTSQVTAQTHAANNPPDDFDLDVQLGSGAATPQVAIQTSFTCPDSTCRTGCDDTCPLHTCVTCAATCRTHCGTCATCQTCQTQCGQATCAPTCVATCAPTCAPTCAATCHTCNTQCGQNTCVQTQCGQQTCHTCRTLCGQQTCNTCRTRCLDTCATCVTCETCHHPPLCQ
jgi:hypothetical protein